MRQPSRPVLRIVVDSHRGKSTVSAAPRSARSRRFHNANKLPQRGPATAPLEALSIEAQSVRRTTDHRGDVKGPFVDPLPRDLIEQPLPALSYQSIVGRSPRFHARLRFYTLNRGVKFARGGRHRPCRHAVVDGAKPAGSTPSRARSSVARRHARAVSADGTSVFARHERQRNDPLTPARDGKHRGQLAADVQ